MHSEDLLRFRTLCLESKAEYKSKGSRFLAFAYPVVDEEAVKYCNIFLLGSILKQYMYVMLIDLA